MSPLVFNTIATICFVAGKSGGHILPCITKAQQLHQENNSICLFSSGSDLDNAIVSKHNWIKHVKPAKLENIPSKWWKMPWFCCQLGYYFCKSVHILWKIKPQKIISFGGLVSIPVCIAGKLLGIPIELHELNVEPGRAISFLARYTDTLHIYFPETARAFPEHNCILNAYPIRFTQKDTAYNKKELAQKLHLRQNKKTILILGGSQGSTALNQLIKKYITETPSIRDRIQVIHQTGSQDSENYSDFYKQHEIPALVFQFHSELQDFYNMADIIICRSGAGTLFEIKFFHKKCLTIPHETTSTCHQIRNAESMAQLYPDQFHIIQQKNCSLNTIQHTINSLLNS